MWSIITNTFREIIRSKFFSLIFLFSIILFVGLIFLNILALDQPKFIIFDFWLSFIEIIWVLIIVFFGNRLLSKEFEEKTIYLTLSRPLFRGKVILAKFFGFSAIIVLTLIILSICLLILAQFFGIPVSSIFFISIFGILFKILSLVAIILFFSIFLSNAVATFSTLAVYIIAHSGYSLLEYAQNNNQEMLSIIGKGVLFIFPNFQALNFKNMIHLINLPSPSYIFSVFGFASIYIIVILVISYFLFARKNFDNI